MSTFPANSVFPPVAPGGGGVSDGDKGDIVVSSSGSVWTVETTVINSAADARIAAASINALTDVTVSSPSVGQVLKWDGAAWVNDADSTGGGGGASPAASWVV